MFDSYEIDLERLLTLSTYVLARIKSFIPDTGGMTQFKVLRKDGRPTAIAPWGTQTSERALMDFDQKIAALIFAVDDRKMSYDDFGNFLNQFTSDMRFMRSTVRGRGFEELLRRLNA